MISVCVIDPLEADSICISSVTSQAIKILGAILTWHKFVPSNENLLFEKLRCVIGSKSLVDVKCLHFGRDYASVR